MPSSAPRARCTIITPGMDMSGKFARTGIPAGIVSAVGRGRWWDAAANAFALWGISTPNFWLGILLILLFSVQLGWLPASGYVSPFEDLGANLAAMVMPAFVLGNAIAGVLMRHTRSSMLQVLSSDYVRTARSKGLPERVVVTKHAFRNALTPVITLGALELGTLLSGAVLTEQVFTIPGFGKLVVDAVFNRDYAVVQGVDKIIIALITVQWAYYARTVRGAALAEKNKDYITAAQGLGLSAGRIVLRHLLPNCLPPLIVVASVQVAHAIALEATLSFLGLGLPITEPSLGLLIANGYQYLLSGKYWVSFFPGVALLLTIVSINLVADQLRDVLNPRLAK